MSSDLIMFTGFEGCTSNTDVASFFHAQDGPAHRGIRLENNGGYLGSKGMYLRFDVWLGRTEATRYFPANLRSVHMGFHVKVSSADYSFLRVVNAAGDVILSLTSRASEVMSVTSSTFTNVDINNVPIAIGVYFHIEFHINVDTGTLVLKINGIEYFNESGLNLGSTDLNRFILRYFYFDNIWIHKTKSLGQAIAFFSKPTADGHYAPNAGFFQTNDGSPDGWAKLQENDGDNNYIYSQIPDAKFTCKQELLPIGYQPVAYCIQSIYKNISGGGLLYVSDLLRYNSLQEDFLGEIRAVPSVYRHSTQFRTNYDLAPDGTELTRDKINDMEIGSQIVELEE